MMFRSIGFTAVVTLFTLHVLAGRAHAGEPTKAECVTASNLSLQLADEHKLRAQRTQLLTCSATSCVAKVREVCLERLKEVNRAAPNIVFKVKDGKGNDLSAVRVTMDGEILAEKLDGSAIEVDPGEHKFMFETAGQVPVERQLLIHESEKERSEEITIGPVDRAPPVATPVPEATQVQQPPVVNPAPKPPISLSTLFAQSQTPSDAPVSPRLEPSGPSAAAPITLVLGIIGIGTFVTTGALAMDKKSSIDSNPACSNNQCLPSARNDVDTYNALRMASTVGLIAGGALLATSLILYQTTQGTRESVALQVGPGSTALRGDF